jgi:hypothetical protein
MPSELENIVAALRALARDAAQLRPFVRAAADRQRDILQELQAIGARLPEAQRSMRILDASIGETDKVDPALATIDQIATKFASRVLRAEAGPGGSERATGARSLEEATGGPRSAPGSEAKGSGSGDDRNDDEPARSADVARRDGGVELNPSAAADGQGADERPVPEWVHEVAARLRYPETKQTVGVITDLHGNSVRKDENGNTLADAQIWSGRKGPAEKLEGLRTDTEDRVHQWATVRQHVEGHAAAWMRGQPGDQHVALVVSKAPCPAPEEVRLGEMSCQVALPRIIRRGSSLTVYVAEPGERPYYFDTYRGNGEATTK